MLLIYAETAVIAMLKQANSRRRFREAARSDPIKPSRELVKIPAADPKSIRLVEKKVSPIEILEFIEGIRMLNELVKTGSEGR